MAAELGSTARTPGPSPLLPMIIGSALFMQNLDSTAIVNALPTMARSLHQDPLILNLAITAYLLSAAVFLPISGWIADRFGAKTVFQCAMIGFAVSSLFCGLAGTLWQIVAARILQGMAGAMMAPVGRLVLLRSVPKSQLVQALAYLTIPGILGPVLGPPIGGFIVTFLSWRWIFFINLPISLLGVVLTGLFMPNVREAAKTRLDLRGFVLSGLSLAGLVFGLENVGRSVMPPAAVALLLGGGAFCGWLYVLHFRRTQHAVLDLGLLKIQTFRTATLGGLFSRMGQGATPFLLALLLQLGFGLSAFQAGVLTLANGAGALMMRATASPTIRRFGFKRVLTGNAVVTAAILASYGLFTARTPHWLLIASLLVGGFFRSLQFTSLQALTYADVPPAAMSRATSFGGVFQQLAQSVGVGAAAFLIRMVLNLRHTSTVGVAEIAPVFVMVALLSLGALAFTIPLPADAGSEVSRHRPSSA